MTPRASTPTDADKAPAAPQAWEALPERARGVRAGLLTIAVIMLGAGCIVAFYAALRIASVWFEHQYVPIVQLAVAGAIIGLAVLAVRRLNGR